MNYTFLIIYSVGIIFSYFMLKKSLINYVYRDDKTLFTNGDFILCSIMSVMSFISALAAIIMLCIYGGFDKKK